MLYYRGRVVVYHIKMEFPSKDKVAQQVLNQTHLNRSVAPDTDYRGLFCEMCGEPWSVEIAQEIRMRAATGEWGSANSVRGDARLGAATRPNEPTNDTPQGIRDGGTAFLEQAGDDVLNVILEWASLWRAMVPSERPDDTPPETELGGATRPDEPINDTPPETGVGGATRASEPINDPLPWE